MRTEETIRRDYHQLDYCEDLVREAQDLIYKSSQKIREIADLYPQDRGYLEAYLINHLDCMAEGFSRYDHSLDRWFEDKKEELKDMIREINLEERE